MRTSVNIEDGLLRAAKEHAARTGRTVTSLIEEGLRRTLEAARGRTEAPADLPVHEGSGGLRPGVDLSNNAQVRDIMDGLE